MRVSKCRHPQNQIIAAKSGGLNAKEVEGSMCRCCVNFLRFELRGAFFFSAAERGLQVEEKS